MYAMLFTSSSHTFAWADEEYNGKNNALWSNWACGALLRSSRHSDQKVMSLKHIGATCDWICFNRANIFTFQTLLIFEWIFNMAINLRVRPSTTLYSLFWSDGTYSNNKRLQKGIATAFPVVSHPNSNLQSIINYSCKNIWWNGVVYTSTSRKSQLILGKECRLSHPKGLYQAQSWSIMCSTLQQGNDHLISHLSFCVEESTSHVPQFELYAYIIMHLQHVLFYNLEHNINTDSRGMSFILSTYFANMKDAVIVKCRHDLVVSSYISKQLGCELLQVLSNMVIHTCNQAFLSLSA